MSLSLTRASNAADDEVFNLSGMSNSVDQRITDELPF
jgi:hypothetical protein